MYLQGSAESGKSTMIHIFLSLLNQTPAFGKESCRLLAPTGVAAVDINGANIYSVLNSPVFKSFKNLAGHTSIRFQAFLDVQFMILNEFSLISCSLLARADKRCEQAKPDGSHLTFVGLHFYLMGDIKQLPPWWTAPYIVMGTAVFTRWRGLVWSIW